jgi:Transcriptional activator of glycolytic enzymes
MEVALTTEECPLDAKLESVLPGVHNWHKENQSAVQSVDRKVAALDGKLSTVDQRINDGFFHLERSLQQRQMESDRRIAASFIDIAQRFLNSSGSGSSFDLTAEQLMQEIGYSHCTDEMDYDEDIIDSEPQQTMTQQQQQQQESSSLDRLYQFAPKIHTLSDLYDEWHGIGKWQGDPHGGIIGRNKQHKAKWRSKLSGHAKQHYSRMARSILAIENYAKQHNCCEEEAVAMLEDMYVTECGTSLSGFVAKCQELNYIKKASPRGKRGTKNSQI